VLQEKTTEFAGGALHCACSDQVHRVPQGGKLEFLSPGRRLRGYALRVFLGEWPLEVPLGYVFAFSERERARLGKRRNVL
jgi:hypothetical protein